MAADFSGKVTTFTSLNGLFAAPCHVLVGVSGGADSMALLHLLLHWPSGNLRVSAVHIHHGLRVETADRDEQHVREFCTRYAVPLTVIHADVAMVARDEQLTLEEAGRRVRYAHFESVRSRIGADYIVTAHTASDQEETILMNLVRGCGLDGLTGIPSVRDHIRRPLLCCTREEVEQYCTDHGIVYMEDETNADTRYTRNFIRHRVMPLLRELNPAVDGAFMRMQEHASADARYLNEMAQSALATAHCADGYQREAFVSQPSVIRRRMIRLLFCTMEHPSFSETHIRTAEDVLLKGNASVSLPNGWVFAVGQDVVSLYLSSGLIVPTPQEIASLPAQIAFGDSTWAVEQVEMTAEEAVNVHSLLLSHAVDCDKIVGKLFVRSRMEGDFMRPSGRGIGKSLKKLMNEWRIPAYQRDRYPVICDDNGIVLVPGYASDERVRVSYSTKHYIVCERLEV